MENRDAAEALEAFKRYTEAFRSLDPRALEQHFNRPALMVSPEGVFALPDAAAVEGAYAGVMKRLPSLGYERTVFTELDAERLSRDLAMVRGTGAWETVEGKRIHPFAMRYTMRRTGEQWKILTALIYEQV